MELGSNHRFCMYEISAAFKKFGCLFPAAILSYLIYLDYVGGGIFCVGRERFLWLDCLMRCKISNA